MDEREELERFLKKGASSGAPLSSKAAPSEKDELEAFLAGGESRRPAPSAPSTPAPSPRQTPAFIPLTERQEFNYRLPDLETQIGKSALRDQARMAKENADLAQKSKGLRFDPTKPVDYNAAGGRIRELVLDKERMSLLPPEDRRFLQGTAEDERRRIPIEPRPAPAPPAFKKKRELQPGTKVEMRSLRPEAAFDAEKAQRALLDVTSDPTQAVNYTAGEWEGLQNAAQTVREGIREARRQGRIAELVAERNAEKAAAPGYGEQLVNRFIRGAVGSGAGALRGATLLDPDMESREDLRFLAPENVQDFTRDALSVDPTDESLLSKTVEAAGSAVPFVLGSAAAGAAGAPAWIAPAILGAASNAGQTYDEAIAAGKDPEEAKRAAIIGGLFGITEAAGVGRFGGKAGGVVSAARRGALRELGMTAAKEFSEESFQEGFNQALNNVNAKILSGYDPKRAISDGVIEAAIIGGFVGAGFGGGTSLAGTAASVPGRIAERDAAIEAVRNEPAAPLDLTPTAVGPTNLISLREAAKPEFRKRLDEAATPAEAVAAPSQNLQAPSAAPSAAPVENLTDLLGGSGRAIADNLRQTLRDSVEQGGKLPKAERGSLLDQVFEAAAARGFPRDAATLDKAQQLAGQGLESAKAQFNQAFPAGGPSTAQAQPAAPQSALERLKSLRKPTEADAQKAAKDAEKQVKQAGKEFEAQAKRVEKETEKEAQKQAKLEDRATTEAEGELRRMRLYDESVGAAQAAVEEAEALIDAGDYSGAIGKLRAQQSALGQSVKYLPETPDAIRTKANVAQIVEGISERVKGLRKQALDARAGVRTTAEPSQPSQPSKADQAEAQKRGRAQTGERLATRYRAEGRQKYDAGDLLGAEADYRASLQALNDAMKLTPPAEVGRRTQLRNAITAVENDLRGVSGELKKGRAPRPKTVDPDATTADLPSTPLLDQVNNPEGLPPLGEGPAPAQFPVSFERLAERQEKQREESERRERGKRTDTLSPIEYLKRRTDREGIRVSDRGEARVLGSREAGIVGLTNRNSRWTLADAQVILDEGGFSLDDGRDFTDPSVTENDVLDFLSAYGKENRLDTTALDRRLAEEEAEFYASLPSEALETPEEMSEPGPASERLTAPESDEARPLQETAPAEFTPGVNPQTPARRRTERLPVPVATEENVAQLRNQRAELDRLRFDRQGELTQDLADEYRELGAEIARFENEQAKAERGKRFDENAPPEAMRSDDRPLNRPAPEVLRRALASAEARIQEEIASASRALPRSDTEALDRGVAAVDALFADIDEDVDLLDLLDQAIGGDTDAEATIAAYADRRHGIGADIVGSIIDARRFSRGEQRGRIREIAQARANEGRAETGAPGYGEDGETQSADAQARQLSAQDLEAINQNPEEVADGDYDQYFRSLEDLNNRQIRGLVDLPDWAARQLEARLKQANEIRRGRVKDKRLGPKNSPPPAKAKAPSKKEGGRRLVEQSKEKETREEPPTVVHSNPEIDRKPILAETNRGTVLVANPNNKTGVSEVKDRSDEPSEHKFTSTQVNLPAEIAGKIEAFGRRIPDSDLADDGRESEPHITIKYGLHGWDPKFVEEALAGEGPIRVKFGKVSLFENENFDVVKVDVQSPDLHRINKKVSESQPNTENFPEYKPHATIAYVKPGRGKKYAGADLLEGKTITLDSVTFSGRDGERVEIPLTGKKPTKTAEPAERQPWQMTSDEWREAHEKGRFETFGTRNRRSNAAQTLANIANHEFLNYGVQGELTDVGRARPDHKQVIEKALSEGQPVPPEVLAEYPDLQAKPGVEIPLTSKKPSTGAIPPEAMPELRAPGAPPSPLAVKGKESPSAPRRSYAIPEEAMPEIQERRGSSGTYMGFGFGALQPLLDRDGSRIARRTKVPVPEGFDPGAYAEEVINEAERRKITDEQAAALDTEIEKLVEALDANDGWAVVDAHKRINQVLGSRRKSDEIAKIDAGVWKKLSTLRKAGMLAGVPTHLRNIFGNTLFQQMEEVSRMPAAMMDTLISLRNKRRTVAGPSPTAVGRAIGKAATTGLKEAKQVWKKGLTDEEAKEQQLEEVRFRNPVLDAYTKYVFRALSASDAVFFRGAYDRALSERAKLKAMNEAREGLIKRDQVKAREKELRENPDLDLDLAAKEDARIAVFRNANLFTDKITGRVRSAFGPGGNFAIDTVLPFDRTPSNIVIKSLEYTPLGYGKNVIQLARAKMNREFTPEQQRAFAQTFGRATTGTVGVLVLGYILAARGLLTGFYDEEDKDREALRRAAGQMPASIRLGDRWYSIEGLGPPGTLLALGATVHREWNEEVKDEDDRLSRTVKAAAEGVLLDIPLMGATKEIYKGVTQPGSLGQRLGRMAGSFIPRPLPEIGTLTDDSQRDTASSFKGPRKYVSEFANEIRARLPIARTSLPPKLDVFGEPVRTEKSDVIDPFASRPAEESVRGLRDLLDLNLGLSKPKREKGESGEEYNARVRERGREYKRALAGLSDDGNVRAMSREARRAVYEDSLKPQSMERAGKLSDGSVRIERQIEGLRAEAFTILGSMPEFRALNAKDQKAVREKIGEELRRFQATAPSEDKRGRLRREKRARVPKWTPAELAKSALDARR